MTENSLAESIDDLIRITVAFNGDGTKSDAVRQLLNANVRQTRIAKLLSMVPKDVSSIANKLRKAEQKPKSRVK